MAKLRGKCYWPNQTENVKRYILGCMDCAQHGPATRSQPLHPILVTYPFQLIGIDFVGPLPKTKNGHNYLFNIVCYFTRFVVPFATKTANVKEVMWCLRLFFAMYRTPYAVYLNRDQHFLNNVFESFLTHLGIAYDYSPSGSSKSTGIIEITNRLVEEVLKKNNSGKE